MNNLKEQKTYVEKGRDGWKAETLFLNSNTGKAIEVNTWKGSKGLVTRFQHGKAKLNDGGFSSFSFIMFQDKNGTVAEDKTLRCTEKTVTDFHTQSLIKFREDIKELLSNGQESSKNPSTKRFFVKDLTGRGFHNNDACVEVLSQMEEISDDGEPVDEWATEAEEGDKFKNAEVEILCTVG